MARQDQGAVEISHPHMSFDRSMMLVVKWKWGSVGATTHITNGKEVRGRL